MYHHTKERDRVDDLYHRIQFVKPRIPWSGQDKGTMNPSSSSDLSTLQYQYCLSQGSPCMGEACEKGRRELDM